MTDLLGRIEPVARDLLGRVDGALLGLGAPAGHPVWGLLRRLNATPGAAVDFFAAADPAQPRSAAVALRALAERVGRTRPGDGVPWRGRAAEELAAQLAAVRGYFGSDRAGAEEDSLLGRLAATASYVEGIADWYERSRDTLAGALAEVLTSAQAVILCAGGAVMNPAALPPGPVSAEVVLAAADIGARLLESVAEVHAAGQRLAGGWDARLGELGYRGPVVAEPGSVDSTVWLRP